MILSRLATSAMTTIAFSPKKGHTLSSGHHLISHLRSFAFFGLNLHLTLVLA